MSISRANYRYLSLNNISSGAFMQTRTIFFGFAVTLIFCMNINDVMAQSNTTPPSSVTFDAVANYKKQNECDDEETVVYFSNGVANDWRKAKSGANTLAVRIEGHLSSNNLKSTFGEFVVANAFTDTLGGWGGGFVRDFVERFSLDRNGLNGAQFYRWLQSRKNAPEWFTRLARVAEEELNVQTLENSVSAGKHADGYNQMLNLGRSNIVVGHSYGTILANASFFGLNESNRKGHAIVMAALMDDEVSGASRYFTDLDLYPEKYPYTTIAEDQVVALADLALLDVLSPNVDNWAGDPVSKRGHGFEEDYLSAAMNNRPVNQQVTSLEKIMNDIVEMKGYIEPRPCHGHLVSGGSSTTDTITGMSTDKQIAVGATGMHTERDFQSVPVLSSSGLSEKFIDWRGQFEQGEATRVLTYRGPAARYNGSTTYSNDIYRWGKRAYAPPQVVLGAAIQKDASGDEFVVAATHDATTSTGQYTLGDTVTVWRRRADLYDMSSAVYDPASNPLGWQRVLVSTLPDGLQNGPWFFNGSGTKAGALRQETKSRSYGTDRLEDPACQLYPGVGICAAGGYGDDFPAGTYDVSELRRYTLEIPLPGASGNGNVIFESHEWGDKAVLAVDYDDDRELLLREENMSPRGFLQNGDPDSPSDFKWLTLNGQSIFDQSLLNCFSASGVCRTQRSQGPLANTGGFIARLGDIAAPESSRNTYHVFYSDLRTDTFAYSILDSTGGPTQYWVVHQGQATFLGESIAGSQAVPSYISARYGYEGDYRNTGPEDIYRDPVTGTVVDAEKVNPILGRYELSPISDIRVSNPPVEFGFDVAADKSLLATGLLSDGTAFNVHSVLGDLQNFFAGANLSGQTLLPMAVR